MREFDYEVFHAHAAGCTKRFPALRMQAREPATRIARAILRRATGLTSQWERAERRPQGASLVFLEQGKKNGLETVA